MLKNELEYIAVSNTISKAKIALQGGHIFDFQIKGKRALLWLSKDSCFEKGKAIRGGIPICWPWFGAHKSDPTLPNHGFARTSLWKHIKTDEINDQQTKVTLQLKSSNETLKIWPYLFELTLEITVGQMLSVSLTTKNLDIKPFSISQALHTYLLIEDINQVYIDGLDQKRYYNKVDDSFNNLQDGKLFFIAQTDRIYQRISSAVKLHDKKDLISLRTEGSQTVVIWNPAEALAAKMPDLSDHKTMVCIESANTLEDELLIQPNESHSLRTIIFQG